MLMLWKLRLPSALPGWQGAPRVPKASNYITKSWMKNQHFLKGAFLLAKGTLQRKKKKMKKEAQDREEAQETSRL